MHDEASAHYQSMIDQTALGHKFLKEEFGYTPTVGWQIDPFGHSNTHAWLSSAVGFDSLFFGRIDYQDQAIRMKERTMEMIWKGSASDSEKEVFTGVFTSGNYGPPDGFCFDSSCVYCRNDPVVEDPLLQTYNADAMTEAFIAAIYEEQSHSVGNHVMIKMGADFTYDNANTWYKSMDVLIRRVNALDPQLHLFYSDPVQYTRARAAEGLTWTQKTDDFFPYSDSEHSFWTGYFTSRPTLKLLERYSSGLLQVLKQFSASTLLLNPISSILATYNEAIQQLTAAVGLVNHHDAITGTSKQHVAEDYKKILSLALDRAESVLTAAVAGQFGLKGSDKALEGFTMCRMVNESVCAASQSLQGGGAVTVVAYNPLPRKRSQQLSVLVTDSNSNMNNARSEKDSQHSVNISVYSVDSVGGSWTPIVCDVIPIPASNANPNPNNLKVVFMAENIPSLASNVYVVVMNDQSARRDSDSFMSSSPVPVEQWEVADTKQFPSTDKSAVFTISNQLVSVTFNKHTGEMVSMARSSSDSKVAISISQDLKYYTSYGSPGNKGYRQPPQDDRDPHLKNIRRHLGYNSDEQASGAYIFRPTTSTESAASIRGNDPVKVTVVRGQLVTEVWRNLSSWASQVTRIREGQASVEIEWTVGPIPVDDQVGKEVVLDLQTDLLTDLTLLTDSNGREFLTRRLNERPTWSLEVFEPVAGNYYPLTVAGYVRDEQRQLQLSVLADRSQGVASLRDGQMEVMIHRRLLADDNKGVDEPLNETASMSHFPTWQRVGGGLVVRGSHHLLLSPRRHAMAELRGLMDQLFLPPTLFYSTADSSKGEVMAAKAQQVLSQDLPVNVHLVTLEAVGSRSLLVRLGHQFAVGEDPEWSGEVEVDLKQLLAAFEVSACEELNLSANQLWAEQQAKKIRWKSSGSGDSAGERGQGEAGGCQVRLTAMQIKTFLLHL